MFFLNNQAHHGIPTGQRFEFPSQIGSHIASAGGILLGLFFLAAAIITRDVKGVEALFLAAIAWLALMVPAVHNSFKRRCDVILNGHGIYSMAFGRCRKFIAWSDVQCLVQQRSLMTTNFGLRLGHFLFIRAAKSTIIISDEINGLPNLLEALNQYAHQFNIPIIYADRAPETRARINATVSDPAERKRILKGGVKTPLTELKGAARPAVENAEAQEWGPL